MSEHGKRMVYLDSNSTTELSHEVSGVLMDILINNIYGNPSNNHEFGKRTKTFLSTARFHVARSLNCSPTELVFTSGGTEANNLALRGTYDPFVNGSKELIISAGEHSSVYNTALSLATEDRVRIIPLNSDGVPDLEWADRLITEDVEIVSVMMANNETGVIYPIKEIVEIAHSRGVMVHCDAVQAYGKIPINVKELGVDLLSVSGHKVHALPGAGALYIRKGILVHPILTGGPHESAMRAGTENYVGIASLGCAAEEIYKSGGKFSSGLRDNFEEALVRRVPNITINGKNAPRIPNTSNITVAGVHSQTLVEILAERGVLISSGSACSTGLAKPSRVLMAMGLTETEALSSVRFSFSKLSTINDVTNALNICSETIKSLRQVSGDL